MGRFEAGPRLAGSHRRSARERAGLDHLSGARVVSVFTTTALGVVALAACLSSSVQAQGMWPQQDFRDAADQELADTWRDADPYRFAVIQGDFDGDGLTDQARLQYSPRTHEAAVFVFLAKPNKSYERIQLLRLPDNAARAIGLANVKAGRYTTACGKSTTFQCKADEPQQVTLERDGISLFRNGGTSTYYWWDDHARRFAQAIITE